MTGLRIGTSGWSYAHWEHIMYPAGTPPYKRLEYYFNEFRTVELNSSFYRWPRESAFRSWRNRLPDNFLMSVKAPRGLTHAKKLYSPENWLARIERSWHLLLEKRGILLVQLSPEFAYDYDRLAYFIRSLPWWLRTAVEFRHPSWNCEPIFELLERHQVAYCIMSGAHLPCILRATAPFVYIRMHGPDHQHLYAGSYSSNDLGWWAEQIRIWRGQGRDVFVYFNNDGHGYAVHNARELCNLCNQ